MVVAFEIHNPIPRRNPWRDARPGQKRWTLGRRMFTNKEHIGQAVYPWWRPQAWEPRVAGRAFAMRSLLTIWHVEPGGHDSGEICKHHRRWQDSEGWHTHQLRAWRFHVHHWRIQVPVIQELRRRLFQRCGWCGGWSTTKNPVNHSSQWESKPKRWWSSDPNLYHGGCATARIVDGSCLCEVPLVENFNGAYGTCTGCEKYYRSEAVWIGHREAVVTAGIPERGKPWVWPEWIDVREIETRLNADRGA